MIIKMVRTREPMSATNRMVRGHAPMAPPNLAVVYRGSCSDVLETLRPAHSHRGKFASDSP